MQEADARRIADDIARRLGDIINLSDVSPIEKPLTFADILFMGFFVAAALRSALPQSHAALQGGFPVPPELLTAFYAIPRNPTAIADLIYSGLLKSDEEPEQIQMATETVSSG